MFRRYKPETETSYYISPADEAMNWEVFSVVRRFYDDGPGFRDFKNSCGLFPDLKSAQQALRKLRELQDV